MKDVLVPGLIINMPRLGVNIDHILAQASALISKKSMPPTNGDDTHFGSISADFTINQGITHTNDLLINNPHFAANGTGVANLNTQTLNLNFMVKTTQTPELDDYNISLQLAGAILSPHVNLDTTDLLAQILKKTTKTQTQTLVKSQLGNLANNPQVQNALNSLLA